VTAPPLLRVQELVKSFEVRRPLLGRLRRQPPRRLVAVDGVTFTLPASRTLGIVGESGSGKTTLARCLTRLVEPDAGSIAFDGRELVGMPAGEFQRVRREMQIVFQDPYSSLNPQMTAGAALAEALRVHGVATRAEAPAQVAELLRLVGLPAQTARRYPRELSGGQRQRVAIARALAPRPRLLIADEAVSALDVSIQAQILNLLVDLTERLSLTTIFISHQLSVIAHVADAVAVMYLGRIVESGPVDEVFGNPQHPYTAALLAAHPEPAPGRRRRAAAVRGERPSPLDIPAGCRFRTRCPYAQERCAAVDPPPDEVAPGHVVRCVVLPLG
jgi:peptide/nickel transport system ATP-binding protein/oligopeptide transport system ATP-binding protein